MRLLLLIALSAISLLCAGCETIKGMVPEKWNDPAYFGDGDDLGKNSGGVGTGNENWDFNW